MTYRNSNAFYRKTFPLRSRAITKYVEMRTFSGYCTWICFRHNWLDFSEKLQEPNFWKFREWKPHRWNLQKSRTRCFTEECLGIFKQQNSKIRKQEYFSFWKFIVKVEKSLSVDCCFMEREIYNCKNNWKPHHWNLQESRTWCFTEECSGICLIVESKIGFFEVYC